MNHAHKKSLLMAVSLAGAAAAGCGAPEPGSARDAFEDAVVDRMVCEDLARPSTIGRLRDALDRPGLDTAAAFALAPEDLAGIVSLAGPQAEAVVVVVRNVGFVVNSGFGADLVDGSFDGVSCGDEVAIACVAGSGVSVVECGADGVPTAVSQKLDRCVLHGTQLDGTVRVSKDATKAQHLRVDVNDLSVNETSAVHGVLDVTLAPALSTKLSTRGARPFSLRLVEPFALEDHGGLDGGFSCGEELDLDVLDVVVDGETTRLAINGAQRSRERDVGVSSDDGEVVFDGSCACPRPGSTLSLEIPRPLGGESETSIARVQWSEATDEDACAAVDVEIVGWTNACDVIDGVDCGRGAVEATLGALLQSFCFVN